MNSPHLVLSLSVLCVALTVSAAPADPLESGFRNPPDSAKPQTWWHWVSGNITREGISADLEAMQRIGLGGATIVNVDCGIPAGSVAFMSPEWRADFKFAVQEADRLGLKLCVENCAGWANSGGPWNTAANAMPCLTASETNVHGPAVFDAALPQPATRLNYYRDIAVVAYPSPAVKRPASSPERSAGGRLEIKRAVYQSPDGSAVLDVSAKLVDLLKHGASSASATTGAMGADPAPGQVKQVQLDFILDGEPGTLTIEEGGTLIFPLNAQQLAAARKQEKTAMNTTFVRPPPATDAPVKEAVPLGRIVDLSAKQAVDGHLHWVIPPGDWIILRLGYTPIGVNNHPAPKDGTGLECDKLSQAALDAHWDGFMQKVLGDAGPLAGKSLNAALIDSYEVGNQDWTGNFRAEFQRRRGYDPVKFLPTFTRQIVESPAVTERFLWDIPRTVADLFAENYYGHFAELCRQHGLSSATEPYFGPYESMLCGAPVDVVMGEFWAGSQGNPTVKLAVSIAHAYGKSLVGAESFTASADAAGWQKDPYALKTLGDLMFCQGLNRYYFHRYALQPWTNRWPGMTMGGYGTEFERTQTWWEQGKPWMDYLSRCEFLLQQGRAVADVAYFTGESAPVEMRVGNPALPKGYDYDAINADVLRTRATVQHGRIVLASGASYAVLVLPPNDRNLTPPLLECLRKLVGAGATVVGPPPQHSPSLADYPKCDATVKKLADELWGRCDGTTVNEHTYGRGHIVWGETLADILAAQKLAPDFEFAGSSTNTWLAYIHRVADAANIYFVSNQRQQFDAAECTFRVTGKIPELWHPDTGVIEPAPVWNTQAGRTTVHVNFDPAGSVFVIFRRAADAADQVVAASSTLAAESGVVPPTAPVGKPRQWETLAAPDGAPAAKVWGNGRVELRLSSGKVLQGSAHDLPAPQEISGAWQLSFPPNWGAPPSVSLAELGSWTDQTNAGVRYFSGTAIYEKEIEISPERLSAGRELWLDLGAVKNFAEVFWNGRDLGVFWKPPFRVNVAAAAKSGLNHLEVKVTNLWPNRLIGDEQLPPDCEWDGDRLKAWPPWLLAGQPSPTGRLTFAT